jgi:uncharacterized protein
MVTDFDTASIETVGSDEQGAALWPYFTMGVIFGITLTKAEIVSWFRIQEMFRFQAFHMYGVIGSAVAVAAASVSLLKRLDARTLDGQPIQVPGRALDWGYRHAIGGAIFGLGWALTGACPGPLFILVGAGLPVMVVAVLSAIAGTWVYGYVRPKLPR